jgi:hypothetical protein
MGYTSQTQHKPSARAKKTLNYLSTRSITIEIIAGEKQYFLWYQHKKNTFTTQSTLDGVIIS